MCGAVLAIAQDTRRVQEPAFPPVCTRLAAQTKSVNGALPAASETSYDTAAVQSAMDTCPAGQAVELQVSPMGDSFLIGAIRIPAGVTLLVDAGVTVFASRNPRDYDANASKTCGTITANGGGCNAVITANHADGGGLMGYGVIDGRGYLPMLNGSQPGTTTWWDLANQANTSGGSQNNPRLLQVSNSNGFTLYKITIKNSPNFHVALGTDTNFTAWGVKIIAPYDSRNTDGIDPGYSRNVTITQSYISDGDDNVAVGGNNPPGATNISVVNNHFGNGHGASIGSYTLAGVSNILFDHIIIAGDTADGNQNGLRIKSDVSRGGLVQNITYSNICMQGVRHTIVIDPFYTAGATGNLIPNYSNLVMRNVHATTEGTVKIQGHDSNVPTTITLDNVQVDNIKSSDLTVSNSTITLGPNPVNFASMLTGSGLQVTNQVSTTASPLACPASLFAPIMGELIPGQTRVHAGAALTAQVQVITTKETTYQSYLTRLKTDPNATLNLARPTGTVTLYDGATGVGSVQLDGSPVQSVAIAPLAGGRHTITAAYSGDASYPAFTFGSYVVSVSAELPRPRR